ncbi:unnamed protein product [Candida verbasci]|uniref:Uncharacterized protein n=1 Tax=Candida verbasci TaxID=1227364 RepID=A0A9W4XIU4_9ASCO|nr:unnamed protein product [Candida verbasci]
MDETIDKIWLKNYEKYCLENGLNAEEIVKKERIIGDNQFNIDIGKEIPKLNGLIQNQNNKYELQNELKQLIMKFYWAGYQLRKDSETGRVEKSVGEE